MEIIMNSLYKTAARENMLKSQILTGHVLDQRILGALAGVAREEFVPPAFKGAAYVDQEIALGNGRFLMEPIDFARLLKYADLREDETVLDIGCASGYSATVLSKLARRIVAVEEDPALAQTASRLLASCPNVVFVQGPLTEGARTAAPYDAILVEGAVEHLPGALADQLKEGGRLLTAEHDAAAKTGSAGLSKLAEYRKVRGKLYKTVLHDANMALLPSFARPPSFTL
jgi:protein-L-isoaspartate(D-aspartate) O-methyltransferase